MGCKGCKSRSAPLHINPVDAQLVRDFWTSQGVVVTETTPEQHDRDSVYSQAFTYSVARIILNMRMPEVGFRTRSFDNLTQVAEFSANDSDQLFHDMLFYNPYYPEMKKQLEGAIAQTQQRLDEIATEQSEVKPF